VKFKFPSINSSTLPVPDVWDYPIALLLVDSPRPAFIRVLPEELEVEMDVMD
jgi:hypothetical protein